MGTALFGNHSSRGYEVLPSSSRISLDMNRLMLGSWVRVSYNPLNGWYSSRHNLAVLGSRLSVCTIPNTQTDWHQGRIPLRSIVEEGLSLIDAAVLEDDAEESSEVESLPLEPGMDTPSRRADAGMLWGILVHGLLEHTMRHKGATRDDMELSRFYHSNLEPRLQDASARIKEPDIRNAGFTNFGRPS
jgi:hypothetical protein